MNAFTTLVLVSLGGASGAVARWMMASFINAQWPSAFPWATLSVNVLGCGVFGVIYAWSMVNETWREPIRMLFLMGFMGAFTTFSTFSFETLRLIESGKMILAIGNILGSLGLCLLGTWAGLKCGKLLFN